MEEWVHVCVFLWNVCPCLSRSNFQENLLESRQIRSLLPNTMGKELAVGKGSVLTVVLISRLLNAINEMLSRCNQSVMYNSVKISTSWPEIMQLYMHCWNTFLFFISYPPLPSPSSVAETNIREWEKYQNQDWRRRRHRIWIDDALFFWVAYRP